MEGYYVIFEVLTAVTVRITIFWDMTQCIWYSVINVTNVGHYYKATRRHMPEEFNLHNHGSGNPQILTAVVVKRSIL
jgi:hypothetical protein